MVTVSEALAAELVRAQFAPLPERSVRFLAAGWDNTVFVVDETWAFRFPRRAIAVPGIEREMAMLPQLAPMLPLPVPVPRHIGRPGPRFGWPFLGARLIPGRELGAAGLDAPSKVGVASALGGFLRRLHARDLADRLAGRLPHDPMGRAAMGTRVPITRARLAEAAQLGLPVPAAADVEPILAAAERLPPSERRVVAHGDLHLRHLLVEDGSLTGIIDWGDVCMADPSVDLSLGWTYFEGDSRAALLEAYGPVSAADVLRARVLGLMLSAALATHARSLSIGWLERATVDGLRRVVLPN